MIKSRGPTIVTMRPIILRILLSKFSSKLWFELLRDYRAIVSIISNSGIVETAFNAVACFSYLSTCTYLGYVVYMFLKPMYVVTPYFQVYPAMSAAY
ncbi:uncharacterized protein BDFB_011642, partial [Asbolus verrucosus]